MRYAKMILPALLVLALAPAADVAFAQMGTDVSQGTPAGVDARWMPWLGCWELSGDAVDYREVENPAQRLVCVTPRPDGRGVGISTWLDGESVLDETLVADAERHPVRTEGCEGWQVADWSDDGRRLFSRGELTCEDRGRSTFQGVSLIVDRGVWLDIQAVSMADEDHSELVVRRYRTASAADVQELGVPALEPARAIAGATARAAAAAPLTVPDVAEAAEWLPTAGLEALVMETSTSFEIDADTLIALSDAGVEDTVIDLIVALSYPDRFIVDRDGVEEAPRADDDRYGYGGGAVYGYPIYGPYGPYYYSPYRSFYDPYFAPFWFGSYAGFYRFPGRVSVRPRIEVPPSGSLFGGRVLNGRGYTRIRERPQSGGGGFFGRVLDSAAGGSRTRGSGGGPAGVGSSGGSSTASPKGYTRGSSGGGRKAVPRGGGGGKAKAKPGGGGGGN